MYVMVSMEKLVKVGSRFGFVLQTICTKMLDARTSLKVCVDLTFLNPQMPASNRRLQKLSWSPKP